MSSSPVRAVGVTVLLVTQLGLIVWLGALPPAPELGSYPDSDHLRTDYERYTGQHISTGGRVIDTDPVVIALDPVVGSRLELEVEGLHQPVHSNQHVRIFGIANEDRSITAIRTIVVPSNGLLYTYSVSLLAGLWVLGRLLRHWRIDRDSLGLAPKFGDRTAANETPQEDRDA